MFNPGDEQIVKALAILLDRMCERLPLMRRHLIRCLEADTLRDAEGMEGVQRIFRLIIASLRGEDVTPVTLH